MPLKQQLCHKLPFLENVSRETFNQLEAYIALLQKWNQTINLIGKSTEDDLINRHIVDSLQLLPYIPKNASLIDLGSGAGLPGIILSIFHNASITLVESNQKKTGFLQHCRQKLHLKNLIIKAERIEKLPLSDIDIVTARALADLNTLLGYAEHFSSKKDYFCLFLKGQNVVEEIEKASLYWDFSVETYPSITASNACILRTFNIKPKEHTNESSKR